MKINTKTGNKINVKLQKDCFYLFIEKLSLSMEIVISLLKMKYLNNFI